MEARCSFCGVKESIVTWDSVKHYNPLSKWLAMDMTKFNIDRKENDVVVTPRFTGIHETCFSCETRWPEMALDGLRHYVRNGMRHVIAVRDRRHGGGLVWVAMCVDEPE